MDLKKVALSLLLGASVFAVGCGDDDDDAAEGPATGDVPTVTCTVDGDTMTRSYALATLAVPPNKSTGFNIDGLTTPGSAGAARTAGCGHADGMPGGIDNQLADLLGDEGQIGLLLQQIPGGGININEAIQGAVDDGAIEFTITLSNWNGTNSDECVTVELEGEGGGESISLSGRAPLVSGRIDLITFGSSLSINPAITVPNSDPPETVNIPITIAGGRARVQFSPDMNSIISTGATPTTIGGYILYDGTAEQGAFKPTLMALVGALDFDIEFSVVDNIFAQSLDLRTQPTLQACTNSAGPDSLSAAILASATLAD